MWGFKRWQIGAETTLRIVGAVTTHSLQISPDQRRWYWVYHWIESYPAVWHFPTFTPAPYDWQRDNRRDYGQHRARQG